MLLEKTQDDAARCPTDDDQALQRFIALLQLSWAVIFLGETHSSTPPSSLPRGSLPGSCSK